MDNPTTAALDAGSSSPSIAAFAAALAKAQAVIEAAVKDSKNPHFNSRYADLASVWDACRVALTSNGISVVQMPVDVEGARVGLRTVLMHSSGEFVQSVVSAPLGKNDAQAVGSALTYLRRYSLAAMVGVAPDDDDGNAASNRGDDRRDSPAPAARKAAPKQAPEPATPGEHHPSWKGAQAGFCAALAELGVKYDVAADYCEANDRPRPSSMDDATRARFLAAVKANTGGTRDRILAFGDSTGGAK